MVDAGDGCSFAYIHEKSLHDSAVEYIYGTELVI